MIRHEFVQGAYSNRVCRYCGIDERAITCTGIWPEPEDVHALTSPSGIRDILVLLREAHRRLDEMGVPPARPRPLVRHEVVA